MTLPRDMASHPTLLHVPCPGTWLAEAIHELAAQYRLSTGIAALKVQYSGTKGFYLLVPSQHIGGGVAAGAAGAGAGAGGEGGGGDSDAVAHGRRQLGRAGPVPQLPK